MGNEIVGIRYIGLKDRQEDTVCKTGAIWLPGQVHNFSAELAQALLVHTDSFERADVSVDGGTYLSRGGKAKKTQDVAAFVNLSAMNRDQLIHMARVNFNRVINPDGKDDADIRREVHGLMTNHNLDLEADRINQDTGDGKVAVPYMASPEEYAALMAGTVVLAIVPAEVASMQPAKLVDMGISTGPVTTSDEAKPLPDLLASLEKPDLINFAKQEGVRISNTMTAEKLREKIQADLTAREEKKAA